MTRESLLARTLVELADTLVDEFDVVDLLVLLADRCVEALDVQAAGIMLAGPDGQLRVMASSSEAMHFLEQFEVQTQEGPCFDASRSGHAVVNQDLDEGSGRWPRFCAEALDAGFNSAHALKSRVVLEQAKGVLAERLDLDMEGAFTTLRNHARNHNLRLVDVAVSVIDGSLPAPELDEMIRTPIPRSADDPPLRLHVVPVGNVCVVSAIGELDLTTRDQLVSVAMASHHPAMVIDLGEVTFMDCSGYGALVASRLAIEGGARSLTITGHTGQPGTPVWKLIADL